MNRKTIVKQSQRAAIAACCVLMGVTGLQSCKDEDHEVLTGQPSFLGNSIYERLQEDGHYKITLKLIDEMAEISGNDEKEVMSKTGSRTLFVTSDEDYQKWFEEKGFTNGYDDLSNAMKLRLMNSAIVENAYLIELLSNQSGTPVTVGKTMRRTTRASLYDSVVVMKPEEMPVVSPSTKSWDYVRGRQNGIKLLVDATTPPMIHFLPNFMKNNNITAEDLEVLTNGKSTSIEDSWVNGMRVVPNVDDNGNIVEGHDIVCKNGYIHKVEGIMESAPNMHQIIHSHPELSRWASLLDRFTAPYFYELKTFYDNAGNVISQDSVFELRYFASKGRTGTNNSTPGDQNVEPEKVDASKLLKFDPAWNQYRAGSTGRTTIGPDAAVMIVPTNQMLDSWWEADGKPLQDKYHEWDSIPDDVVAKLINVNMLENFTEAVPSKFDGIVDDAKMELGIKPENVVASYMGCNGVVYVVNRTFSPRAYSSVTFPALIHKDLMETINWAFEDNEGTNALSFGPYLNSMESVYSLFIPSNTAMLQYIDPATFGETSQILYEFYYDTEEASIAARRWEVQWVDDGAGGFWNKTRAIGKVTPSSSSVVRNRLEDMLNMIIVVGDVDGWKSGEHYSYYRTKGGSLLKVENAGTDNMTVSGGYQLERNSPIAISSEYTYDMSATGNGKSYMIDKPIMGATKSVYQLLSDTPEMSTFLSLLIGNDADSVDNNLLLTTKNNSYCPNQNGNYNMRLFEKFNYTVYVPENDKIQKLIDDGYLPTWEDYEDQTDSLWKEKIALLPRYSMLQEDSIEHYAAQFARQARAMIRNRIINFVRYHIQDNALAIDGQPVLYDKDGNPLDNGKYETAMLNKQTRRFFSLDVTVGKTAMTIKDQVHSQPRNVVTSGGLYNLMCREYWFSGKSGVAREINSVSDAVVHLIDDVLLFDNSLTEKTWQSEVNALIGQ